VRKPLTKTTPKLNLRTLARQADTQSSPLQSSSSSSATIVSTSVKGITHPTPQELAKIIVLAESDGGNLKLTANQVDTIFRGREKQYKGKTVGSGYVMPFMRACFNTPVFKSLMSNMERTYLAPKSALGQTSSIKENVDSIHKSLEFHPQSTFANSAVKKQFEPVITPLLDYLGGADGKLDGSSLPPVFLEFLIALDKEIVVWHQQSVGAGSSSSDPVISDAQLDEVRKSALISFLGVRGFAAMHKITQAESSAKSGSSQLENPLILLEAYVAHIISSQIPFFYQAVMACSDEQLARIQGKSKQLAQTASMAEATPPPPSDMPPPPPLPPPTDMPPVPLVVSSRNLPPPFYLPPALPANNLLGVNAYPASTNTSNMLTAASSTNTASSSTTSTAISSSSLSAPPPARLDPPDLLVKLMIRGESESKETKGEVTIIKKNPPTPNNLRSIFRLNPSVDGIPLYTKRVLPFLFYALDNEVLHAIGVQVHAQYENVKDQVDILVRENDEAKQKWHETQIAHDLLDPIVKPLFGYFLSGGGLAANCSESLLDMLALADQDLQEWMKTNPDLTVSEKTEARCSAIIGLIMTRGVWPLMQQDIQNQGKGAAYFKHLSTAVLAWFNKEAQVSATELLKILPARLEQAKAAAAEYAGKSYVKRVKTDEKEQKKTERMLSPRMARAEQKREAVKRNPSLTRNRATINRFIEARGLIDFPAVLKLFEVDMQGRSQTVALKRMDLLSAALKAVQQVIAEFRGSDPDEASDGKLLALRVELLILIEELKEVTIKGDTTEKS
jgi:hypothetical protein